MGCPCHMPMGADDGDDGDDSDDGDDGDDDYAAFLPQVA